MPDVPAEATDDMLPHYSAALDEVYRQRVGAVIEAHMVAGVLAFASLPKGAREQLEEMRDRLLMVARGFDVYGGYPNELKQRVKATAGVIGLTRSQWEARDEF